MTRDELAKGMRVKAFHPAKFGVVDHGTVVRVGTLYVQVDFGTINGGTFRIPFGHVVDRVS